jgi:hypothetical protein
LILIIMNIMMEDLVKLSNLMIRMKDTKFEDLMMSKGPQ